MLGLQEDATSIIKDIKVLDNRGVHNFSYHTLQCYFKINTLVASRKIQLLTPWILEIRGKGSAGHKLFVYAVKKRDQALLQEKQIQATIYSIDPLPLEKENKFIEIQYDLEKVFTASSYASAKKRHQRIKYPFTWMEKNRFVIKTVQKTDPVIDQIYELHEIWRQKKEDDPKTYKIMFPSKRYIYCVEQALLYPDDYICFVALKDDKVYAVRIVGIQGEHVFDLAFFGNQWEAPSQLMNYIDVVILHKLLEAGYSFFNCGSALNKQLKNFKTHLPYNAVTSYKYSKLAEKE